MRFRTGPGVARRVLVIAAVAAIAATGGCSTKSGTGTTDTSASPENVSLRFNFWGAQDRADVTAKAVAAFQTKYPNIKVETSFAEFNAYFTKLATEVGGGAGPDVMQMDFRYLREYADRGVLAELNANGVKVGTGDISSSLLASGKVRG
jgi:multiple sugar transport system substrate-binding protein